MSWARTSRRVTQAWTADRLAPGPGAELYLAYAGGLAGLAAVGRAAGAPARPGRQRPELDHPRPVLRPERGEPPGVGRCRQERDVQPLRLGDELRERVAGDDGGQLGPGRTSTRTGSGSAPSTRSARPSGSASTTALPLWFPAAMTSKRPLVFIG